MAPNALAFVRRVAGCLVCLALATAQAQGVPDLPDLLDAQGAIATPWRVVGFPKSQRDIPLTQFSAGSVDGERGVRVEAQRSYGTLTLATDLAPSALRWRWRLDQPLQGGERPPDILSKAGDDAALKVCALFDHPLDRVPFVERQLLRLARAVSGEALPAATVCYVWDSRYDALTESANPYTRRVRFVVLRGAGAPLQQWVDESRDLAQDFRRLFGDEQAPDAPLPRVTQLLIGADADNTGAHSIGWVRALRTVP
ncbi:DUF3047 domain-containing protein [Hydrogenophaga sp.]|uniref:DUF3047 domain-containing protein n=1 Tax=Hydrogenophaga sp. TaxID=1904254 RepID=UPI0025C2A097|nr:DUF3047 domain-containing protein [Hydrogenophaga sp.]